MRPVPQLASSVPQPPQTWLALQIWPPEHSLLPWQVPITQLFETQMYPLPYEAQAASTPPQLTHCELALQICPVPQSPLLRQVPVTQLPLWQRWFAPKASVQAMSPVQSPQKCVVGLQILGLQVLFCLQSPATQSAVAP